MEAFLPWLVKTLFSINIAHSFMRSKWGWPTAETIHFLGLSLLVGAIGAFDLRMLGIAKRIPMEALHRLVPWGILGYCINITTGLMFLTTEPDQYIYNPSFHFKILFMAIAGLNVLLFYSFTYGKVKRTPPGAVAPRAARWAAAASLACWIGVIVCGRMLTFYRPFLCDKDAKLGLLYYCIPPRHK